MVASRTLAPTPTAPLRVWRVSFLHVARSSLCAARVYIFLWILTLRRLRGAPGQARYGAAHTRMLVVVAGYNLAAASPRSYSRKQHAHSFSIAHAVAAVPRHLHSLHARAYTIARQRTGAQQRDFCARAYASRTPNNAWCSTHWITARHLLASQPSLTAGNIHTSAYRSAHVL